jgi:hypothetical protein
MKISQAILGLAMTTVGWWLVGGMMQWSTSWRTMLAVSLVTFGTTFIVRATARRGK